MKRCFSHILGVSVMVFALSSIGAKEGCSAPSGTQPTQDPIKPFCYMDPPLNCVAFCIGVDEFVFTPQCNLPASGDLFLLFRAKVESDVADLEAQGIQVCPAADTKHWVTPCNEGIEPVEHPNQDHEVCQPVPPGCPTSF